MRGLVTFAVDFARGPGGSAVFTGRWSAIMIAGGAASVVLTGCAAEFGGDLTQPATTTRYSTVTATLAPPPSATTPAFYRGTIRGDGVFSVAGAMSTMTGADGRIPPGRYRVELLPDAAEGSWMRCRSLPCGPDHPNAAIVATTLTGPGSSNVLDIGSDDVAVWLSEVSLTPIS